MELNIYFDGSCQPQPGGIGRWGFKIYQPEGKIPVEIDFGQLPQQEKMTNNIAEFEAVLHAVQYLNDRWPGRPVAFWGDSKLVINQLAGVWAIKSETSKKYVREILDLLGDRETRWLWIPRENNPADALTH